MTDPYEEWKAKNPPRPDDAWERFEREAQEMDKNREGGK